MVSSLRGRSCRLFSMTCFIQSKYKHSHPTFIFPEKLLRTHVPHLQKVQCVPFSLEHLHISSPYPLCLRNLSLTQSSSVQKNGFGNTQLCFSGLDTDCCSIWYQERITKKKNRLSKMGIWDWSANWLVWNIVTTLWLMKNRTWAGYGMQWQKSCLGEREIAQWLSACMRSWGPPIPSTSIKEKKNLITPSPMQQKWKKKNPE